jgi:pimeloyl-ACP methyl ester carboxylesterase
MTAIVSNEYWVAKGEASLYVFRKRLEGRSGRVLFLIHGSSLSAIPSYDLHIPVRDDYSVMDHFAQLGFDVWTMDHDGYGRSSRTGSNADIADAVVDLKAAWPLVARESGREAAIIFGQSGGALRAAAFAQACPEQVERLILDGFVWTGKGSPTLENVVSAWPSGAPATGARPTAPFSRPSSTATTRRSAIRSSRRPGRTTSSRSTTRFRPAPISTCRPTCR